MSEFKFIAGSGRSGTTWVLDTLAEANNARAIFEPLHPSIAPEGVPYSYLDATDKREGLVDYFGEVHLKKYKSMWCDYRLLQEELWVPRNELLHYSSWIRVKNRWKELLKNQKRFKPYRNQPTKITKIIRGNLMLGWLREELNADVAFVVRHPCAVYHSRLGGSGWDPYKFLEFYISEPQRAKNAYINTHLEYLTSDLSHCEAQAAVWCIENVQPIKMAAALGYNVFHYEDLVENGPVYWPLLSSALGLEFTPSTDVTTQPSQMASSAWRGAKITKSNYQRWVGQISVEDMRQIQGVLDTLGCDFYNVDTPSPCARA